MSLGSVGQTPLVVFVVEDEALIQGLLVDPLEEAGYQVLLASSGDEAIKLLDSPKTASIRALVTDVNLGRSSPSGWEVARKAREAHPEIPVVYLTGDSAHEWPSQGVPNSVLITKPFAPAQIVTAVSQLINQATSVSTPPQSGGP
jgi:DNA-binding response OmpR family regulator